MKDIPVIASMLLAIAALVAPYLVRRSAKETADVARDTNALSGFADLVDRLTAESRGLRERVERLEADRDRTAEDARLQQRLLRRHEPWDREVFEQLRQLGHDISEPPPLDIWNHDTEAM